LRTTADARVEQLRLEGETRIAAKLVMNAAYQQMKAQMQGLDDVDAAAAAAQGDAAARIEQLRADGAARLADRETMATAYMAEAAKLKDAEAAAETAFTTAKIARLEKEGQERIAQRADIKARYTAAIAEIEEKTKLATQPPAAAPDGAETLDRWAALTAEGESRLKHRNKMAAAYTAEVKKLKAAEAAAEATFAAAKIARLEQEGQERIAARAGVKSLYDDARAVLDQQAASNAKFEVLRAAGEATLAERSAKSEMYEEAKAAAAAAAPPRSVKELLLKDVGNDVLSALVF